MLLLHKYIISEKLLFRLYSNPFQDLLTAWFEIYKYRCYKCLVARAQIMLCNALSRWERKASTALRINIHKLVVALVAFVYRGIREGFFIGDFTKTASLAAKIDKDFLIARPGLFEAPVVGLEMIVPGWIGHYCSRNQRTDEADHERKFQGATDSLHCVEKRRYQGTMNYAIGVL